MPVAHLLLTLLFVTPSTDVDEATHARVEAWLDGFCEHVVGGAMLSPAVMDGGEHVDLDALQDAVRARGRTRGVEVGGRVRREVREEYAADFVAGGEATSQELVDVVRVDEQTLDAFVWVEQPEFEWSMAVRLREGPDGLRAVDWMTTDVGMWKSELLLELHGVDGLAARTAYGFIAEALGYVLVGEVDLAREQFAMVPDMDLPGTLDSWRDAIESVMRGLEEDGPAARAAIERALAHDRVAPVAWYFASTLAVDEGDHERGLALAERYLELAPNDVDGLEQAGWAHLGLDHGDRARELAFEILRRRPYDVDVLELAFLGWAAASETERAASVDTLIELLQRDGDPVAMGRVFLEATWWLDDSLTAMARLVELVDTADCCPELALYLRAYQAWWIDDWETVVDVLEHELDAMQDAELQAECADLLVEAHLQLGDPLAAYASAPDPATGFRNASQHLFGMGADWGLAALIATYETEDGAAQDPWLELGRGHVFWLAGDTRKAELAFVRAGQLAGDDWFAAQEAFDQRLSLRWELGDLAGAYDEIEPQGEVLAQLLSWCDGAEDADGLAELLQLHADDGSPHGRFPAAEAQLQLLTGDDAQAAEALFARRAELVDTWGLSVWESRTINCFLRLGRDENALAVAEASTARDGDPWYEVRVHIRTRNADGALDAIDRWLDLGWGDDSTIWYHDELIDDLRSDALRAVRERYPEPEW